MPFRLPFRPFAARLLVFFALGLSEVWAASVVPANAPFPALVERATLEKLPISGIEPLQEGATLRSGDFVVALLTSSEGPRRQQWLAEFRVVELTPQERAAPAPVATTVHTSTGRKFEFASHTAALRLRMFGPYAAEEQSSRTARAEEARVLVKTDFLAAGFDRNCAVALRIHEAKLALPYLLAGSPFPADRAARDAATAQANGITLEDERAMAVTGPALVEFLEIAQRTPGLKSLVGKIADLPPLLGWFTGGTTGFLFQPPGMARLDGASWGLPSAAVYRAPFNYHLKGAVVMKGTFFFAAPKPPLLACAGILALQIESPKHPEKSLELRILAARRHAD